MNYLETVEELMKAGLTEEEAYLMADEVFMIYEAEEE